MNAVLKEIATCYKDGCKEPCIAGNGRGIATCDTHSKSPDWHKASDGYAELLVGCGNARKKAVSFDRIDKEFANLTTLDIDPSTKADVVWDLNVLPLPFADNSFDEIHAYEVLEHCGRQGDWKFFLDQFGEFWRILKPGGYFIATCPMWDSPWAWADPGHTRVITKQSLIFLNREEYKQIGETAMTDYRQWLKCDFETVAVEETEHRMAFVLRARK